MSQPEYLICLSCESPSYTFEYSDDDKLLSVVCQACGNDNLEEFVTESELEEQG